MNKIDWSEKSIFRKIIIIISALQVVAFFALPYARMNSAVGSLNAIANSFGANTGIPNNLTGFAAVKMFSSSYAGVLESKSDSVPPLGRRYVFCCKEVRL